MLASGIVRGLRRLESSTDTELDKLERTSLEKQTVQIERNLLRIFKRKLHKKNKSMNLFCSVFKCFVFVVWCLFYQTLLSPVFAGLYECFLLEGDSSQKLCFSLFFLFFFSVVVLFQIQPRFPSKKNWLSISKVVAINRFNKCM